jgi:hypothetical protein
MSGNQSEHFKKEPYIYIYVNENETSRNYSRNGGGEDKGE